MRVRFAVALLASLLATSAVEAASNASPAVFFNSCSPNDMPALKIVMDTTEDRRLEVRLWGDVLDRVVTGQSPTVMISPETSLTNTGRDIYVCNILGCEQSKAQLRIGTYEAGKMLDGELIWHTGNGTEVIGIPFVAEYRDAPVPCG